MCAREVFQRCRIVFGGTFSTLSTKPIYTSVANSSSDPYRLLFLLVMACIDAAVGKSYFLLFTEDFEVVGGCESLQKRKEHIRVSTLTCHNGLTKSRHPTTILSSNSLHFHYYSTLLPTYYQLLLLLKVGNRIMVCPTNRELY